MNIKRKIAVAITSSALIFNAFASTAFASTTLVISGNGADSNNDAQVNVTHETSVVQSNNAQVDNQVTANADTGNNTAKDNTGGDVSVTTGDVDTTVNVSNALNSNTATVDCCPTGNTTVEVSSNGADSKNTADVGLKSSTEVYQTNNADVTNKINTDSNTGYNKANDNTGGDTSINTGDVTTSVTVSTAANANSATVGGGGKGGTLSAIIHGNGADSTNKIDLDFANTALLVQDNNADVNNKVEVDSNTGHNRAEDNTGGDVTVDTGNVDATVGIDNLVNFNAADISCGCLLDDVLAKVWGNGADSRNDLKANIDAGQQVFQSNCGDGGIESLIWTRRNCGVDNKVNLDSSTGYNNGEDNTQGSGNDPTINTGDATHDVTIDNTGNANVLGPNAGLHLPGLGFDLNLTLNLSDLLAWFTGHA